jgi:hypothetical protein
VTRFAGRVAVPAQEVDVVLDLLLGPTSGYTLEELRLAWEACDGYRDTGVGRGWRPWGCWKFEIGEDPPEDRDREPIRLAVLGLLTEEEQSKLSADADRARAFLAEGGPFYYRSDEGARRTIELCEAVERALERP